MVMAWCCQAKLSQCTLNSMTSYLDLLLTGLNLIPAWINNYILYNVWDEITYPFPNFNGGRVREWISHFIPLYWTRKYYLSMLGLKLSHVSKRGHRCHQELMCECNTENNPIIASTYVDLPAVEPSVMPQLHPTMGPVRFYRPYDFLPVRPSEAPVRILRQCCSRGHIRLWAPYGLTRLHTYDLVE